jgi:hypothetical protein
VIISLAYRLFFGLLAQGRSAKKQAVVKQLIESSQE